MNIEFLSGNYLMPLFRALIILLAVVPALLVVRRRHRRGDKRFLAPAVWFLGVMLAVMSVYSNTVLTTDREQVSERRERQIFFERTPEVVQSPEELEQARRTAALERERTERMEHQDELKRQRELSDQFHNSLIN